MKVPPAKLQERILTLLAEKGELSAMQIADDLIINKRHITYNMHLLRKKGLVEYYKHKRLNGRGGMPFFMWRLKGEPPRVKTPYNFQLLDDCVREATWRNHPELRPVAKEPIYMEVVFL